MYSTHFETVEIDENRRVRFFVDYDYRPEYAYGDNPTEEESEIIEREWEAINRGDIVPAYFVAEKRCGHCGEWKTADSLGVLLDDEFTPERCMEEVSIDWGD